MNTSEERRKLLLLANRNSALFGDIRDTLYQPLYRTWKKQLTRLIQENSRLHRNGQECLRYRGAIYGMDNYGRGRPIPRPVNGLHLELTPQFQAFLEEKEHIEQSEIPYVEGYLRRIFSGEFGFEDLLQLLPQALHGQLKKWEGVIMVTPFSNKQGVAKVLQENDAYIRMMKVRMSRNLIENS